jgi:hypothetical protein
MPLPAKPARMMGFLPNLSDSWPQKGENINWPIAKDAARSPMANGLAPYRLAYMGKSGNTNEKATILTNTVAYKKNKAVVGIGLITFAV